jgi:hypothetical protein
MLGTTFDGKLADQSAIKKTGSKMTLEEFLNHAENNLVTTEDLHKYEQEATTPKTTTSSSRSKSRGAGKGGVSDQGGSPFSDGPPCLQHLAEQGVPDGGRNSTLFMMGLYFIRVDVNNWTTRLEEANRLFFNPPLSSDEVQGVIKSIEKKGARDPDSGYRYTCRTQPMASHCNSKICRGRKHGIGSADEIPKLTGITKMGDDPPVWFLTIGDLRLELATSELQNAYAFQSKCLEKGVCFQSMKQQDWIALLSDAMSHGIEILDMPGDVGIQGQFKELLDEFLTDRQVGEDKEELLRNVPWKDYVEKKVYFKLSALQSFLEKANFKHYRRGSLVQRIRDLGGDHHFFSLKGNRGLNVWYVPMTILPTVQPAEPPRMKESPF